MCLAKIVTFEKQNGQQIIQFGFRRQALHFQD